ncbi:MAG: DNA internalization-related competence protein ComEC/Rec2 [Firmicutes bacterium]|nr:DNA internalization-related competence protein ComEC/Rec2 [Bacillota bacterium]
MKRPLLILLYAQILGILLAYYSEIRPWQLCAAASAAVFLIVRSSTGGRRTAILLLAAAAFLAGGLRMSFERGRGTAFLSAREIEAMREGAEGPVLSVSGTVYRSELREGYAALWVKADSFSGASADARGSVESAAAGPESRDADPALSARGERLLVRLYIDDERAARDLAGRRVELTGTAELPSGVRNPGGFDYARYLRARGVRVMLRVSRFRFAAGGVELHVIHRISLLKGSFFEAVRPYLGEDEFPVLTAVLFGEKSYMEDGQLSEYRASGISHVMAVSGLHAGLVYASVSALLRGRKGAGSTVAVLAVLALYAAASDFSVSVLRAASMIALHLASFHLRRRYDLVSAAALCCMAFTLASPYTVFDSGFQLSFAAAYSIGIALPRAELALIRESDERKSDLLYRAGSVALPCLMIQMGMLPLLCYDFLRFSPASLAVNPPAVAAAALELPLGLLAFLVHAAKLASDRAGLGAASLVLRLIFTGLTGSLSLGARFLNVLSRFSAGFARDVPAPPPGLLMLWYCGFFFFFSETRAMLLRRRKDAALISVWAAFIAASALVPYAAGCASAPLPWSYGLAPVCFVDVGQGDCVHVHAGGKDILIDGGGSFYSDVGEGVLKPYLLKNGVTKIDLAFVTHPDIDHMKGLAELSKSFPIEALAYPGVYEGEEFAEIAAAERLPLRAPDRVELGGASFEVLLPGAADVRAADDNANSLVMMLRLDGLSVLLTGDMDFAMEERLLAEGAELRCGALKAAHHGSAYSGSEAFVLAADPGFEAISCGRNNSYGHPAPRVIDLASENGIMYGRTDLMGAVLIVRAESGGFLARNASGSVTWHIRTDRKTESTLSRRSER